MRLTWRGNWKKGEISVETESVDELVAVLKKLEDQELIRPILTPTGPSEPSVAEIPTISGSTGPSDAIRQVLSSPWGRAEPRTMTEIVDVLKANAIYFSEGSLSGILTYMTKKGEVRRPMKRGGKWAYILSS